MRTALLIGVLAACLVVSYARYKSSDFTDAGENCIVGHLIIYLHAHGCLCIVASALC